MKCPHCNQEHPDGFQFCPATGKKIEVMKACINPKCPDYDKHILPPNSQFCPTCGFKLEENESDKQAILDSIVDADGNLNFTVDGVDFKMVFVQGGLFEMGNNDSEACDNAKPKHWVELSDYYIGETTVTQALWKAVMRGNPSSHKGDNLPVENVAWEHKEKNYSVQEFIRRLNEKLIVQLPQGRAFRLPTEAEWEYAARGGQQDHGYKYSGSNSIGEVAWYDDNSGGQIHPVKLKKANELGLYDMCGNVIEWCNDYFSSYSSSSQTNPTGPSDGSKCVARGGGCSTLASSCCVWSRWDWKSDTVTSHLGFRLALPK